MQLEMAVMAQQCEAFTLRHRTLMAEPQNSDRPSLQLAAANPRLSLPHGKDSYLTPETAPNQRVMPLAETPDRRTSFAGFRQLDKPTPPTNLSQPEQPSARLRLPPNDSRSDSTRNRVKTAPRLYDMKCGAESYGLFGSGGRLPVQVQLRQ